MTCNTALNMLVHYLIEFRGLDPRLRHLKLVWDVEEDKRNKLDPRGFCHVEKNSYNIHCSLALDYLPLHAQVGVILHEIGHIYDQAFRGDTAEVDADLFAIKAVPTEADYGYDDVEYVSPFTDESVIAKNCEIVSPSFARLLREKFSYAG